MARKMKNVPTDFRCFHRVAASSKWFTCEEHEWGIEATLKTMN